MASAEHGADFADRGLLALRDLLTKGATIAATAGNDHRTMWADAMNICGYSTTVDIAAASPGSPDGITIHLQDAANITIIDTVKIRIDDAKPDVALVVVLRLNSESVTLVLGVCRCNHSCARVCTTIKEKVKDYAADAGCLVGNFNGHPSPADVSDFLPIQPVDTDRMWTSHTHTWYQETRGKPQSKRHRKLSIEKSTDVWTLVLKPPEMELLDESIMCMLPPKEAPCKVTKCSTYWANHLTAYTEFGPFSIAFLDLTMPPELPADAYRPMTVKSPAVASRSGYSYDIGADETVCIYGTRLKDTQYLPLANAMTEAWTRSIEHESIMTATTAAKVVTQRQRLLGRPLRYSKPSLQ